MDVAVLTEAAAIEAAAKVSKALRSAGSVMSLEPLSRPRLPLRVAIQ
jgi:hypothetical protein